MKLWVKLIAIFLLAGALSGAIVLTVGKTPFEQFDCAIQFEDIDAGDIAIISATATNRATGADTTATIIAASPAPAVIPATNEIGFRLKGGTLGETHLVSIKAQKISTGELLEGGMVLAIRQN